MALSRKYFEQSSKKYPTTTLAARSQLYIIGFWMPLGGQKRFGLFKERVDNMAFKTTHNKDESLPQFMKSPQGHQELSGKSDENKSF